MRGLTTERSHRHERWHGGDGRWVRGARGTSLEDQVLGSERTKEAGLGLPGPTPWVRIAVCRVGDEPTAESPWAFMRIGRKPMLAPRIQRMSAPAREATIREES